MNGLVFLSVRRRSGASPTGSRPSRHWAAGLSLLRRLARDPRATSALEYGLIASMIAVLLVLALTSLDIDPEHVGATISRLVTSL